MKKKVNSLLLSTFLTAFALILMAFASENRVQAATSSEAVTSQLQTPATTQGGATVYVAIPIYLTKVFTGNPPSVYIGPTGAKYYLYYSGYIGNRQWIGQYKRDLIDGV
jgi:hypothetical protein